jgi:hypothetical protein
MKNKTTVQIDSPGRRAAAYWFVDGLPEILFGFYLLIPGLYVLAIVAFRTQIAIQNLWIKWMVLHCQGGLVWHFGFFIDPS